jgi:hypothetical protein
VDDFEAGCCGDEVSQEKLIQTWFISPAIEPRAISAVIA